MSAPPEFLRAVDPKLLEKIAEAEVSKRLCARAALFFVLWRFSFGPVRFLCFCIRKTDFFLLCVLLYAQTEAEKAKAKAAAVKSLEPVHAEEKKKAPPEAVKLPPIASGAAPASGAGAIKSS